MTTLGVNIDHIANVREARKTVEPDPVQFAFLAELGGADSITVHLREDRRHIQDRDIFLLKETIKTKLNLEMAATEEMLEIAKKLRPDYVTLVPEKREEVTTEGGLDLKNKVNYLKNFVASSPASFANSTCRFAATYIISLDFTLSTLFPIIDDVKSYIASLELLIVSVRPRK